MLCLGRMERETCLAKARRGLPRGRRAGGVLQKIQYIYILYILAIEYLKCLKRIEMYRVFYRLFLGGAQRFPRACGPGPF